ncbi:PaaI family thioesterase [Humitalea sp. 24SJ18S-53]|uniref:PaaI family thioesterase n=1 Tax=Humitalea sp. 24SJ18S-53 TaxID=3422307 RepID=UPI003D669A0A
MTPRDPDFVAKVRESFSRQPFMAHLGARLTLVEAGHVVVELPCVPHVAQQHGHVHGGAVGAIADSAGGYAGFTLFPAGSTVLTVEYKVNFLAPSRGDFLRAIGRVVRSGRTLTVSDVQVMAVRDGVEHLCATATQTLICLAGQD